MHAAETFFVLRRHYGQIKSKGMISVKKFKMASELLLSLCVGLLVTACCSSRDAVADSSIRAPRSAEDSGDAQIPNP